MSCQDKATHKCDITDFIELDSKSKTIEYQHIQIINNKFNSTINHDTTNVSIFKLDKDKIGFQILKNDYEWFYNSEDIIEFNHLNKTKSIEKLNEIDDFPLWNNNLLSMLDTLTKKKCEIISINNIPFQYFFKKTISKSHIDSNKTLIKESQYTFPKLGFKNLSLKEIIIREKDTLQIRNHFLENINFQSKNDFESIVNRVNNNPYQIMNVDENLPFGKEAIREGHELSKIEFIDIDQNKIQIANKTKKYSLVIFSFIGCTPCEIAINQLKEDQFGLKHKVNLYYSSFQNKNTAVKKYLEDKSIFKNAFSKESNMIKEFRLPISPTFVLIDSNGKIIKIIEGFDNSVLMTLNKIIDT